jgi:hypothetical protein
MKDFFEIVFNFLVDTSRKLVHKLVLLATVLVVLFLINNVFGFTYYYNTSRKIEQLKSISELLKDSTLPTAEKEFLLQEQQNTVERRDVIQKTISLITYHPKKDTTKTLIKDTHNNYVEKRVLNPIWVIVTSALFFWVVLFLLDFALVREVIIEPTSFSDIIALIFGLTIIDLIIFVVAKGLGNRVYKEVQVIANQPWINYVIYTVINLIFLGFLAIIIIKEHRLNKEKEKLQKRYPKAKY